MELLPTQAASSETTASPKAAVPAAADWTAVRRDWFAEKAAERRRETDAARGSLSGGVAGKAALFGGTVARKPTVPKAATASDVAPTDQPAALVALAGPPPAAAADPAPSYGDEDADDYF